MRLCARSTLERLVMTEPLLSVRNLRAGYRDAVVLDDIAFDIPERGGLAVLGRNGAGKTTLLLAIMGHASVRRGQIMWRGSDITRLAEHRRALLGIGWVAQERDIFPSLTVDENLTTTARPGRWTLRAVYDLFPRLAERRANKGNQLSGGEQQMLAFGRALMTNPSLLLLDEPLEGLAPIIIEELTTALQRMTVDDETAFLLVEQHSAIALSLAASAIILERGRIAFSGASRTLTEKPAILERFIGLAAQDQSSDGAEGHA